MAELIGKRYAEALYEVALELDKLEEFKEEIKAISQILKSEPKLKTIFEHPKLSKDEKKDIINSIFKERVSQEILNLCYIVIDKGRETHLTGISEEYTRLSNEKQGIVEARAITAVPMEDEEMKKLEKQLSKKLDKKVLLSNEIDSTVMGGVLVKIGDKIIDSSIKGRFEELYKDLNNVRVRIG
ncbi:F0F1 ATP synthase subunit delta [Proteiniborus sp. MB09-C3]|uniref:F0F1 ATP synthase subunit delta n=1 Tax=Proteiniborus sp. MB09-C3 TaxID=3050072 RepID=UPI002552DA91|nr:F0F1 ATP synthase subunit delta [Proteiniborus sp. MB09-C3]WIV12180.1 F0F1 ATP synthase subunit delta [Proteiniborus sp. MB09-C3]